MNPSVTAEKRSYAKLKQTERSGGGAFPSSLPTVHLPVLCLFAFGVSFKIAASSWLQKTGSPLSKLVLVALSEFANETGLCWPSIRTLAIRCEVSERTVQKEIRKLESLGLIKTRPSPGRTSNRYTVTRATVGPGSSKQPRPMDTVTPSNRQGIPVQYTGLTPSNGHPIRSVDPVSEASKKGESPRISEVERIGLEKQQARLDKRIAYLQPHEFKTPKQRDELKAALLRVEEIDKALHIPLGNGL